MLPCMNRRELLSVAAIAPLAAVIPTGTEAETLNTKRLLARIERKFKCVDGPPRSYFEGVTPSGEFGRGIYQTFVNGMATTCGQEVNGLDAESDAINALWRSFEAYAIGKKGKLYWRKRPEMEVVTPQEQMLGRDLIEASPGQWLHRISVEDNLKHRAMTPAECGCASTKYYARMRLIITEVMPYTEEEYDGPYKVDRSGDVWQRRGKVET